MVDAKILAAEVVVTLNGMRASPKALAVLAGDDTFEASVLQPLVESGALSKTAQSAAMKISQGGGIQSQRLLQTAKLYGKVSGIAITCCRGAFSSGIAVVRQWAAENPDDRAILLRPQAANIGVGAVEVDGTMYVAAVFADTCWDLEDNTDIIATLFTAYDENDDGALDHEEYSALCNDLSINLTDSEEDFTLLCEHVNKAYHRGGMTTEGLRSVAGNLLTGKASTINNLMAAKRAGKSVLKTSVHVCKEKFHAASESLREGILIDRHAVLRRLIKMWEAKKGDILDEMLANYKAPVEGEGKLLVFAEASKKLTEEKSKFYPNKNRIDLLNMALYTMAGPDIDMVMSYPGVPEYDSEDETEWNEYKELYKDRNAPMYSSVNGPMRKAANAPSEDNESWKTLGQWIKTACLLMAMCYTTDANVGQLSRGLAARSEGLLDTHNALVPGSEVNWGAPSSCGTDAAVAESYINGEAANATKGGIGGILFTINDVDKGLPLQDISKYPKETEVLLGPLYAMLVNSKSDVHTPNEKEIIKLAMTAKKSPATDLYETELRTFLEKCLKESSLATERLEKEVKPLEESIPGVLADTFRPAFRPFDTDFFAIKRRLRDRFMVLSEP